MAWHSCPGSTLYVHMARSDLHFSFGKYPTPAGKSYFLPLGIVICSSITSLYTSTEIYEWYGKFHSTMIVPQDFQNQAERERESKGGRLEHFERSEAA